jgi:hypothetical protein
VINIKIKRQLEKDPKKELVKFGIVVIIIAIVSIVAARNLVYQTVPVSDKHVISKGPLTHTLYSSDTRYPQGKPVDFFIKIENNGKQPVQLEISGENKCNVTIIKENQYLFAYSHKEIWKSSGTFSSASGKGKEKLAPGEIKITSIQWDQKDSNGKQVSPGTYIIRTAMKVNGENILLVTKGIIEK